jgi:histidyl-tRNA synthetase
MKYAAGAASRSRRSSGRRDRAGEVTIKNLATGEQQTVARTAAAAAG